MSETTQPQPAEEPQGGVPAPSEAPPPAPAPEPDAPPAPPEKPPEQQEAESKFNRRIAEMRSRLSNSERQREEVAQRLAVLEAQVRANAPPPAPVDPVIQAQIDAAANEKAARDRMAEKTRDFHSDGEAAYGDWQQRMSDLQRMGAIPISTLFLDIPNGHKIAAQLRDNPEALDEILAQPTQQGRALALGKYVQQLEAAPGRNVSRVPPPPRPVQARSTPVFNEYQASTDQLLQHYSKQAMDRRGELNRR